LKIEKLVETRKTLITTEEKLMKVEQNPVPIGFVYVQMPNIKSPTEIWSYMSWKDISSSYDGIFFRAEGGASIKFGEIEDERISRMDVIKSQYYIRDNNEHVGEKKDYKVDVPKQGLSDWKWGTFVGGMGNQMTKKYQVSSGQVRPRDMAMRIWERTG